MSTIKEIPLNSPEYPALLKEIADPPERLYAAGHLEHKVRVAIVGSRTPTAYGVSVARDFARELAGVGVEIVSGLAFGIDAAAHEGALEAGTTLAVLPGSISDPQPSGNRELAELIVVKGGALLSEHPAGTPIYKWSFPQRNRIVSGISNVVVVVEGTVRSGALITARSAIDQNRTVFAVPGSIHSLYSEGPNELIRQGAVPAARVEDILDHLPVERVSPTSKGTKEDELVAALSTPKTLSELTKTFDTTAQDITARLSLLEIDNKIYRQDSGEYVLIKRD